MSKTERLYQIERLIRSRGHLSFRALQDELQVSRATLKRDLEYLRDRLGAPIEYDRFLNGYRFGATLRGQTHELPGLWFSERELYSLLTAHQLLSEIDRDGLLNRHLMPLLDRIHQLLGPSADDADALTKRVKIIAASRRPVAGRVFELFGEALLKRRRLSMAYLTRGRGTRSVREVSPQRLVHYRNTWYLDAWCHRSDGLRRFALDAVEDAAMLDAKSREVPMKQVQAAMDAGYGIYAGADPRWAVLHFSARAAQWVAREEWHPAQQGRWLDDGRYELKLPYADETELLMDVLRHGEQVEVVEPPALRDAVRERLQAALRTYA